MSAAVILTGVERALLIGGVFLYKATWSILFGVLVTAIIDVMVDKGRIARLLGGRDIRSLGLATAAGAASSACTFGAVSVGTALFRKGASVENTFAFAMASTNIVFELGILIYVLLGWQYLVAELISGLVLVAIMYAVVRLTLPVAVFQTSRRRMRAETGEDDALRFKVAPGSVPGHAITAEYAGTVYAFPAEDCREAFVRHVVRQPSIAQRARGWGLWVLIARRYFKTLGRIWKSVLIGFTVSGFIVQWVPTAFWHALFISSTGFGGVLENAAVGVLAGVFSFIGSIGIVPFAAALGATGVGFAGVLGCLLSDLITVPVMSVWRSFYGTKAAAYIFVVFFFTMVASGVLVNELFAWLHWLPGPIAAAKIMAVPSGWNLALVMTLLMLAIWAGLAVVERIGVRKAAEPVQDPVCGLTFERRQAGASQVDGAMTQYFCSPTCARLYVRQKGDPA